MRGDTALKIGTDLSLDKTGNWRALPSRPSQKGFEFIADDFVEQGLFGSMAFVLDWMSRPPKTEGRIEIRARSRAVPGNPLATP